ncbi:MAG: hypothetical protein KC435_13785 [Thermomicrobiales bacterium]|nr:hypothetical protein [Thermomicrobiales bacterium]
MNKHRRRLSFILGFMLLITPLTAFAVSRQGNDTLPAVTTQQQVESQAAIQAAATPESSATSATSFSIPIIQGVDEQPMAGPVIWMTTTGDVMYADGSTVTKLAEKATQVTPQTTNVIMVVTDEPDKDTTDKSGREIEGYTITYINLVNGKSLVDDGTFSSLLGGPNTFGALQVLTIADAPNQWSIVNFETMESRSIADLTGGQFRSSDSISVAVSDDFSTIAIGTSQYESEASAILNQQSGLPGEIAVIPADLSSVSWVKIPSDMPAVNNFVLSPDGSKVALISSTFGDADAGMTVSVIDVATGTELTRTESVGSAFGSTFRWSADSNSFLIIAANSVQKWATDGSEPTTLLESEGTILQMPQMRGSSMVYLVVSSVSLNDSRLSPEHTQLVILDPVTGDSITVDGQPWFPGSSYPVQFSVSLSPIPVSQNDGDNNAILVHPITGEPIDDLMADTYDPLADPEFTPEAGVAYYIVQTVTTAQEAPVSVVKLSDGNLAVVTITQDGIETREVALPEDDTVGTQLLLSADGNFLTAGASWETMNNGTSYAMLDLTDPNSEWVLGAPGTMLQFVSIEAE